MRKQYINILVTMVLLCLLGGIIADTKVSAAGTSANTIEIERVDYAIRNIHPGYWQGDFNPNEPRLYIVFWIYINNLENCIANIKTIEVFDSLDSSWTVDVEKNTDASLRYIGGLTRFFDNTLSNNGSVLSLNNYRVVITTKDNQKISKPFTVSEPGQKDGTTKKYLFSEDYRGQKNDSYTAALSWGKITSALYRNKTFDIQFTVNDGRTINGKLQFFDKNKNYLGETRWFINSFSKEILDCLNNGQKLYTNGQTNQVQVRSTEISVERFRNINKTKFILLITKDGSQHANSINPDDYNHESISEPFALQN